jgi:hypothetical protein
MSAWTKVLTKEEIAAYHALTATLAPSFARGQREFYESRSDGELRSLMNGAWNCSEGDAYQLARSYLNLRESVV